MTEELDVAELQAATLSDYLEAMPDIRARIARAWLEGMNATKWFFDTGSKERVVEPDHRLRAECASRLADYLEGEPAKTTNVKIARAPAETSQAALLEAAKRSPALRQILAEILAESETPQIQG